VSVQELEAEARKLPAAERARLAEALWDSIADEANTDPEVLPLSDNQRAELDRRLADYRAHPETSVSWEEVKAHVLGGA
jgi:putative addiction module component (TIGR02574 family)